MIDCIRSAYRRFKSSTTGSMSVEFVLIIPVLAIVFTVAFGTFHAYLQSSRSAKALYVVSDIISRYNIIGDDEIDQFHQVLDALYRGDPDDVNMRISVVRYVSDAAVTADPSIDVSEGYAHKNGYYLVEWSEFVNQGSGLDLGGGLPDGISSASFDALEGSDLSAFRLTSMGNNAQVILVETDMDYNSPVEGSSFLGMGRFFADLRWKFDVFVWPRDPRGIRFEADTSDTTATS